MKPNHQRLYLFSSTRSSSRSSISSTTSISLQSLSPSLHPSKWYTHSMINTSSSIRKNHLSSTAYQGLIPGDGTLGINSSTIPYLPFTTTLKIPSSPSSVSSTRTNTSIPVQVGTFETQDEYHYAMSLMNQVIREGKTWPFEEEFQTLDAFKGYFTSHAAFVVRKKATPAQGLSSIQQQQQEIMGCFYIKPNFPGRCSHICNGGFITAPEYRRMGVGKLMGTMYLHIAKSLGYKSSYFNLVFESNVASVRLWESLGFQQVARLERAARLKNDIVHTPDEKESIFWDTALGYHFNLETFERTL